jgi:uncharacterized alkaline shock family protein YloU
VTPVPRQTVGAAERGATRIADRVVAKIASYAAREAIGTVPLGGDAPHATVAVSHGSARLRISLDLEYPTDIGERCAAVRRQVIQRVNALAGMTVPEVIIQVERLYSAKTRGAAQGRTTP